MDKIYSQEGFLAYEGETKNGKPYGKGKVYRSDGSLHMEGLFGIKGFIEGKIYTTKGTLRYQGKFRVNQAYGPNYPEEGILYDFDGNIVQEGVFRIKKGGVGHPYDMPGGLRPDEYALPVKHYITWRDGDETS